MSAVLALLGNFQLMVAQCDTIKYVSGTRQPAKIIEINDKFVTFKNPKDTTGPTYKIRLKTVEKFVLAGGCIDLRTRGYDNCVKDPTFGTIKNEDFTRNIISFDLLQAAIAHAQLNFERIAKKRNYGVVLFVNKGLLDEKNGDTYSRYECKLNGNGAYYKKMYGGLDFKFYPRSHKKFTPWFSFGVEAGMAVNQAIDYKVKKIDTVIVRGATTFFSNLQDPYTYYANKSFIACNLKCGYAYRPTKHLIIQGSVIVGLGRFEKETDPDPLVHETEKYNYFFKLGASVLLGYAF
ncbi:MAG: hypothetical protein ACXVPN_08105 [Bacteroidia bacterium]